MDPATPTAAHADVQPEGMGEEKETEMGGAHPPDSSGSLPAGTC